LRSKSLLLFVEFRKQRRRLKHKRLGLRKPNERTRVSNAGSPEQMMNWLISTDTVSTTISFLKHRTISEKPRKSIEKSTTKL